MNCSVKASPSWLLGVPSLYAGYIYIFPHFPFYVFSINMFYWHERLSCHGLLHGQERSVAQIAKKYSRRKWVSPCHQLKTQKDFYSLAESLSKKILLELSLHKQGWLIFVYSLVLVAAFEFEQTLDVPECQKLSCSLATSTAQVQRGQQCCNLPPLPLLVHQPTSPGELPLWPLSVSSVATTSFDWHLWWSWWSLSLLHPTTFPAKPWYVFSFWDLCR